MSRGTNDRSRLALAAGVALAALAVAGSACGPAIERPVRGAVPGADATRAAAATASGPPPTLTPSDALRFRALPSPSPRQPEAAPQPAASVVPSPSAAPAAPPIVRTISPAASAHVPSGPSVTVSAVLVGRGADLASASLSVDGADTGARIEKRSAREWSILASQGLGDGTHTARVLVRDASGNNGGFTWQFVVGEQAPAESASPQP